MIERMTIEIPVEYREAIRLERFQKRTTYREILSDMFAVRYGLNKPTKQRKKSKTATPDGSKAGA